MKMQKVGNIIAGTLGLFILVSILAALIARSAAPHGSALPLLPTKFVVILASALAWAMWIIADRLGQWAYRLFQGKFAPKGQGSEERTSNLISFGIIVLAMLTIHNPLVVFGVHGPDAQRLTVWYEAFM